MHQTRFRTLSRWSLALAVIVGLSVSVSWSIRSAEQADDAAAKAKNVEFFQQEVLPILQAKCFKCHGGEKVEGGLRLNSRTTLLKGGESGLAVDPDNADASLLIAAINYADLEMPPTGKLPQEQIDVLTRWVKLGLPWTPGEDVIAVKADHKGLEPPVNEESKKFWSFQRVQRPDVPKVQHADWVKSAIDAFILRRLEEARLKPNPPADKAALLRRAYYDLIGLPPSPDEVDVFLNDESPDAFEKVVDQLLDSEHYGEKWARHWLDLVRYAETDSYERDDAKPFVWRYRDYVIRSLNEDKPYDQFVIEQIAGDELDEVNSEGIIATGYYRLGTWQDEPVDPAQELYEDLDDIVRTTGEVFLGLTIGCARCHNHKLDPIPQRDYYRFLSFFRNVRRQGTRGGGSVMQASVRDVDVPASPHEFTNVYADYEKQVAEVDRELEQLEKLVRDKFTGVEKEDFQYEMNRVAIVKSYIGKGIDEAQAAKYENQTKRRNELRANPPHGKAKALCVKEHGRDCPTTHILARGNAHAPGDEVTPGFLEVLGFDEPEIPAPKDGIASCGRRRVLAEWIASPENPLTARVMVNRVWQHHFGRGIVESANNFGFQGTPPTHPELLDWLAAEFVEGGWKLKQLHKLIMMSNTYQMSSRADREALAKDPQNELFWRFDMRRLTAEELRDSILAVNGSLNPKMYGPSIYPHIPDEVKAGQSRPGSGWGNSSPEDRARRSVYIHIKRSLIVPIIEAFDGPDVDATCPVRFVTTQPTQILGTLNGEFVNGQAKVFGDFLRKQAPDDPAAQVRTALQRATQREPTTAEIQRGVDLLASFKTEYKMDENQALDYYCLLVLNLNEFIYLD